MSVRDLLRNTVVDDLYSRYKFKNTNFCNLSIPTTAGNIEISVPYQSNIISHVREHGTYEPALTREFIECFNSDTVFWDIGGRYGEFSKLAIKCGIQPQNIITVEGNLYRSRILKHNHMNDNIHIISQLVGDGSGDSISINQLKDMYPEPEVMKIDVEGAEYDVIKGGEIMFAQNSPRLYIEIHPQKMVPSSEKETIDTLRELGYNINTIDHRVEDAQWKPFKYDNVPSKKEYMIRCTSEQGGNTIH